MSTLGHGKSDVFIQGSNLTVVLFQVKISIQKFDTSATTAPECCSVQNLAPNQPATGLSSFSGK